MAGTGGQRIIAVLDAEAPEHRRLAETVRGARFTPRDTATLRDFISSLQRRDAWVGLVALEMLAPEPQSILRSIRERAPGAKIIVAHGERSPRLRLAQRLWAVGLLESLVSRSAPPHELAPVLRQTYADALIERAVGEGAGPGADGEDLVVSSRIRFLHRLAAAFTNQASIDGLLRELQLRLPQFVDYDLLEVLVTRPPEPKLFVFHSRATPDDAIWRLADEICSSTAPFLEQPLEPGRLTFVESTAYGGALDERTAVDGEDPADSTIVTLPMVICGELVGCVSLLMSRPPSNERREVLKLISYQLGASIRNAESLERAQLDSLVDELTGAHNRRYLTRVLEVEWRRARRHTHPLSVAMIDVDQLRRINDVHGHLVGDAVLRGLVSLLREQLRETDHLVRYEGDGFLLVMPETGPTEATLVVERLRLLLGHQPVFIGDDGLTLLITVSIGVSSHPRSQIETAQDLVQQAQQALVLAQRSGRDRVCVSWGGGDLPAESAPDGGEKRRFPRVDSQLRVQLLELPEFAVRPVAVSTLDISAGGMQVRGPSSVLRKNAYALVQIEDSPTPLLSQVVWTKDSPDGDRSAGVQFLRPFSLQAAAAPPRPSTALVVAQRPQTRELVARVLRAAGYEYSFVDESGLGPDAAMLAGCSLLIIGESSLRGAFGAQLQGLRERLPASVRIVVINEEGDRREALETVRARQVDHLVAADSSTEESLFATLNKLLLGDYFGMKKYLLWGAEPKSWTLSDSRKKAEVLDGVREVALSVKCHPRVADLLLSAVDEMIINALYRPAERTGSTGAGAAAAALPERPVTVECGSDGRLLAVAVLDEHGLLRTEDMFRCLGVALEREEHGIPEDAPNANLGFHIMLSALSQLAVNINPGRRTEVIGIVDLRKSLREYRAAAPSLGLFRRDE